MRAVLGEQRAPRRAGFELRRAQARDLGADECAVHEIEAQHGQADVVPRPLQVRVEEATGQIGAPAIVKIHDRERDLVHDVDPAHRFAKLDAIEDDELAVDARDVVEMQIAVALADESFLAPAQERAAARGVLAFGPGAELFELVAFRRRRQVRPELREILLRDAQNLLRRAECAVARCDAARLVKGADLPRQRIDVGG